MHLNCCFQNIHGFVAFYRSDGRPIPSFDSYKLEGYEGPSAVAIDKEVLQTDSEKYNQLKSQLLRDAALSGLVGALITQLVKGTEGALIYAAGAASGVGYLFFLSIKVCLCVLIFCSY